MHTGSHQTLEKREKLILIGKEFDFGMMEMPWN